MSLSPLTCSGIANGSSTIALIIPRAKPVTAAKEQTHDREERGSDRNSQHDRGQIILRWGVFAERSHFVIERLNNLLRRLSPVLAHDIQRAFDAESHAIRRHG